MNKHNKNQKVICFDIDNTISEWNDDRDYLNFVPYTEMINHINVLYHKGYYIKLFTARGMIQMNADLKMIEDLVRPPLEEWLKLHNVSYHELIMGKPHYDMFIDDKNITIDTFLKEVHLL